MFDKVRRLAFVFVAALALSSLGFAAGARAATAVSDCGPALSADSYSISVPPQAGEVSNYAPYLPQDGGPGGGG